MNIFVRPKSHNSGTKIIYVAIINLVTAEAGAKLELCFNVQPLIVATNKAGKLRWKLLVQVG